MQYCGHLVWMIYPCPNRYAILAPAPVNLSVFTHPFHPSPSVSCVWRGALLSRRCACYGGSSAAGDLYFSQLWETAEQSRSLVGSIAVRWVGHPLWAFVTQAQNCKRRGTATCCSGKHFILCNYHLLCFSRLTCDFCFFYSHVSSIRSVMRWNMVHLVVMLKQRITVQNNPLHGHWMPPWWRNISSCSISWISLLPPFYVLQLCGFSFVLTLSHGVLQWLSISNLWACLWTLMTAVSKTTGAVDMSWSQLCSCPVRGALIPAAANTASNPHTCCSRYSYGALNAK